MSRAYTSLSCLLSQYYESDTTTFYKNQQKKLLKQLDLEQKFALRLSHENDLLKKYLRSIDISDEQINEILTCDGIDYELL